MSASYSEQDHRREPRMHPGSGSVIWRAMGSGTLINSQLLDVSRSGLGVLSEGSQCPGLKPGDEIAVRYMKRDNRPTHYAVVWLRQIGKALAIGCTRLTGVAVAAGRRRPYGPLLARLRRRLHERGEQICPDQPAFSPISAPLAA